MANGDVVIIRGFGCEKCPRMVMFGNLVSSLMYLFTAVDMSVNSFLTLEMTISSDDASWRQQRTLS